MRICCWVTLTLIGCFVESTAHAAFVHPGCLSKQADLDRMAAKVAAHEQPWKGGWDRLVSNTGGFLDDAPLAQPTINVGGGLSENYIRLAMDCAKVYQCALRYNISGDTAYGDKAVEIMNTWAAVMTGWAGDTNVSLRAGLYGYQMACAGELMRDYPGWDPVDFTAFQTWMVDVFYEKNTYFLTYKHGTCDSHYWANWDLSAMASMMAIGVLCDRRDIFDEGLNYFYSGSGNGNIDNAVHFIHPDGFGQWQESGRDQGHASMGPQLLGTICEIAWNQGIDLYGYERDKFLSSCEYIAKYNLGKQVPYVCYINCEYWVNPVISPGSRGTVRPGWDLVYNHYVNRAGIAAPYTAKMAALARPDGGGFDYGTTSGGFDGLGFTTLTHSLDPIANGGVPGELRPVVKGSQITLSWRGTPNAVSYSIKRATDSGGPYTPLATVATDDNYYVDSGLMPGVTYYYVVSANNPSGDSGNSAEAHATADKQLYGTVIGTAGSWNNAGATRDTVFDGSLRNFFDPPSADAWVGLDLGAGVSAVLTQVNYCPRPGFPERMVGGMFQGCNTPDFSSGVVDLYTITTAPAEGVLTTHTINNDRAFRYIRYKAPSTGDRWCNVAEIQMLGNVAGLSAPAAPAINRAKLVNGFTAALEWAVSANATGYYMKRATASGGPYTIIAAGNISGLEDNGLDSDKTYYYVVSALNSSGQSPDSDEVSVTTQSTEPNLTAYYKMEDNVNDSSANGYDAAAAGSPVYTAGQVSRAIVLDGVDDYVTLPAGLADTEDMTIAGWFQWDGGDQWQRAFDFGSGTTYYMFLTPRSGSNTLRFAITNESYSNEQQLNTAQMPTGRWMHIAVVLQDDTGILYVDGSPADTNTGMTLNPSSLKAAANYLGKSQFAEDTLFGGRIDDLRIYHHALSAAEIAQLADTQTDTAELSILAAWWLQLTADCGVEDECLTTDINGDGAVNLLDFAALGRRWMQ